jgi:RHS repeat-associated protein
VPTYDADGNILADGRWTYTWDGENRLVKMEALEWIQPATGYLPGNTLQGTRLEFTYDGLSRRTSKKTTRLVGNNVATITMEGYVYDGWNVVMISQLDPTTGAAQLRKWSCIWKPDVGSTLYSRSSWQKAGGVGGLAWLQAGSTQNISTGSYNTQYGAGYAPSGTADVHIPMTDHLGNVRHYFRISLNSPNAGAVMSGSISANLEYDAFGREVRATGQAVATAPNTPPGLIAGTAYADALPFHFSTKFTDPESGLNYYGYRYYDPRDGRWPNRDPMGEGGGENLFAFCYNNPVFYIDPLGLNPSGHHLIPQSLTKDGGFKFQVEPGLRESVSKERRG